MGCVLFNWFFVPILLSCFLSVSCLRCHDDNGCTESDLVLPKCMPDTHQCQCRNGALPVVTGCAMPLPEPTLSFKAWEVTYSPNRTWAYEGHNVLLRCYIKRYYNNYLLKFSIWQQSDGEEERKLTDKDSYSLNVTEAANRTRYFCIVEIKLPGYEVTASKSNNFTINALQKNQFPADPSWKPLLQITPKTTKDEVHIPTDSSACYNLPYNMTTWATIQFYTNISKDLATQDTLKFNGGYEAYCKVTFNGTDQSAVSDAVVVTHTDEIGSVDIIILYGEMIDRWRENVTAKLNSTLRLRCTVGEDVLYDPTRLHFNWKVDGNVLDHDNSDLEQNMTTLGSHRYECSGGLHQSTHRTSRPVIISVEKEPLPYPDIKQSPESASTTDHITLSCGEYINGNVTYTWNIHNFTGNMGNSILLGQNDRMIQMLAIGLSEEVYSCQVDKDRNLAVSGDVIPKVIPSQPTLKVKGNMDDYSSGATLDFLCLAQEKPPRYTDLIFNIYRNGVLFRGRDGDRRSSLYPTYALTNISSSDNGLYTCSVSLHPSPGGSWVFSNQSQPLVITVGAAGKPCNESTRVASCNGNGFSFTGKCSDNRCVCSDGYRAVGYNCSMNGKYCEDDPNASFCLGQEYTGECWAKRCVCSRGYRTADNKCYGGGVSSVTSSVWILSLVIATLTWVVSPWSV